MLSFFSDAKGNIGNVTQVVKGSSLGEVILDLADVEESAEVPKVAKVVAKCRYVQVRSKEDPGSQRALTRRPSRDPMCAREKKRNSVYILSSQREIKRDMRWETCEIKVIYVRLGAELEVDREIKIENVR